MPSARSDHRDTRGRTSPYWVSGPGEGVVVPGMKSREELDLWLPSLPPFTPLQVPRHSRPTLKILEICAGSHSVSRATSEVAREMGFHVEVFSIDGKPRTHATRRVDILTYDWANDTELLEFMKGEGVVRYAHASPPCGPYSSLSSRYRGSLHTRDLLWGDSVAQRCLELMSFFNPHYWTIESRGPPGLDSRPFMHPLEQYRATVNYCRYGMDRWKATSIWTSVSSWVPEPRCVPTNRCEHSLLYGLHMDRVQRARHDDDGFASLPPALVKAWTQAALEEILIFE